MYSWPIRKASSKWPWSMGKISQPWGNVESSSPSTSLKWFCLLKRLCQSIHFRGFLQLDCRLLKLHASDLHGVSWESTYSAMRSVRNKKLIELNHFFPQSSSGTSLLFWGERSVWPGGKPEGNLASMVAGKSAEDHGCLSSSLPCTRHFPVLLWPYALQKTYQHSRWVSSFTPPSLRAAGWILGQQCILTL